MYLRKAAHSNIGRELSAHAKPRAPTGGRQLGRAEYECRRASEAICVQTVGAGEGPCAMGEFFLIADKREYKVRSKRSFRGPPYFAI